MSIGKNIKSLRESRGLTQAELAERLGLSDKTVSSWENDRTEPKMGVVERIAVVLQCLKSDIIGAEPANRAHRVLADDESELIGNYQKLNPRGKVEARKRVSELTKLEEYTRNRDESSFSETG